MMDALPHSIRLVAQSALQPGVLKFFITAMSFDNDVKLRCSAFTPKCAATVCYLSWCISRSLLLLSSLAAWSPV